jgi:hypothetical protein
MSNAVEYVPPASDEIEQFARQAYREFCLEHYERQNVMDFASFLQAVSSALAKDLTRQANTEFDNRIE